MADRSALDPKRVPPYPEGTGDHIINIEEKTRIITETTDASKSSEDEVVGDGDDMDALIEDLESDDEAEEESENSGSSEPGTEKPIPEEFLKTEAHLGLTDDEVLARRKKYGLNQMKEQKENHFLKILSYFVGPVQFVMEVSHPPAA